ncbi:MAG: hypothetical protein HYT11_04765, partial [Candidatus Levybacteria bacterium]|nr:hypothetical protein [Candidatus Levybacteria bacterium]
MVSVLERERPPGIVVQNGHEIQISPVVKEFVIYQEPQNQIAIPPGVSEKTFAFLKAAAEQEVSTTLKQDKLQLIERYFNTDISLSGLARRTGIPKDTIRTNILKSLMTIWLGMPPDLQQQFPQEEVIKMKNQYSPEYLDKRSREMKEKCKDPADKKQKSNAMKNVWKRQEYRAQYSASRKGKALTQAHKENISKARQKQWQDQEHRARQIAAHRKKWQNPNYRTKVIDSLTRNGATVTPICR